MRAARLLRVLALAAPFCLVAAECHGGGPRADHVPVAGGDADRGRSVIRQAGCGTCHTIPDIAGADGMVGPPLTAWSRRSYIAGSRPNSPENLVEWILDPSAVEPGTAMPDLELERQQAVDVAAYLYTLR